MMFDRILVPLDGSSLAESVLPHAVAIANAFGAKVTVLGVLVQVRAVVGRRPVNSLDWHIRKMEFKAYLEEVCGRLGDAGVNAEPELAEGTAAPTIAKYAREKGANLIILSSHGLSGLSGWNISSVVQQLILSLSIPVLIIRAYKAPAGELTDLCYRRIMLPLDCSQRAEAAVAHGANLASACDAELVLVHVVAVPEMVRLGPLTEEDQELQRRITDKNHQAANQYLDQLKTRIPCESRVELLVSKNTAAALHDFASEREVDLIVLTAHGFSGGARWPYGSMVLSLLLFGDKPLLIIQDISADELALTQSAAAATEYKGH
jgi:nucleotide-binding universal stress UspA family protein